MPDESLRELKERAAAALMKLPGVTAVGLGGRERDGRPTGEIVLKVFVERKRPLSQLAPGETLPREFEGVGIDVSELAPARFDISLAEEPTVDPPPARPPGSPLVAADKTDEERYRALVGGGRIEVDLLGSGHGTLGCVLVHKTDPNKVYALTSYHVVTSDGGKRLPIVNETRVGQPSAAASPTKCCSSMIGTFIAGSRDVNRDAALIQLDLGMEWKAEIAGIGRIAGIHSITLAEAATLTYAVRKRGARTRLTGGVVESIDTTHTIAGITRSNVTIVRPNPSADVRAGDPIFFSDEGDSGSAVVNDAGEVVALHIAGSFDSVKKLGKGAELPIEGILSLFETQDSAPVAVATATASGVIHTVPGATTVAMPSELVPALLGAPRGETVRAPIGAWLPGVPLPTPRSMEGIRAQLDRSAAGRQLITLWLHHHPELTTVVNEQRRVALVWHRCAGPALLQTLVRMASQHDLALPMTINGRPLKHSLDRIHDAFAAYATAELRRELGRARTALPDLAGLTYLQIIAALGVD